MGASVRKVIGLGAAASSLALLGALSSSVATASAAAGTAASQAARPMLAYSNIFNTASGKCLGTSGGHNNTYTVLWTCNGRYNQSWADGATSPYNGAYHQLVNRNGDCLGLSGGHTSSGTAVVAWRCQGSNVGVAGGGTQNGARVVLWGNHYDPNQAWYYGGI